MKFQNKVRTQLAIVGLGAALLFAGAARAQEIENATFNDGPNVAPFTQPVAAQDALNTNAGPVLPSSQAVRAMAAISASAPIRKASVEQKPIKGLLLSGILVVCIGAVVLYTGAPVKRETRERRSRTSSYVSTPVV